MADTTVPHAVDTLLGLMRETERPALRQRIEDALQEQPDENARLRFVQDLDILVHVRGPQFMYSRGIAETLRVGEDIFELAYVMQRALR